MKNRFRKWLSILLAMMLAASLSPAAVAESPAAAEPEAAAAEPDAAEPDAAEPDAAGEPVLLSSRTARVFPGTLDSSYSLTTWEVEGEQDVPYVPLREYMTVLYDDAYQSSPAFSWEGNVYVISNNGERIYVDPEAQTIRCGNWRAFHGPNYPGAVPAGIVEREEFIALRPSEKNQSSETESLGYEVCLTDYGLRMIRHGEDVLMPFAAAQNVLGATAMMGVLAYNGEDYFDIVNCYESIYGSASMTAAPNPYANRWFSGPFAARTEMSEAYARYNYNSTCLLLDLTYGHREERGIARFDTYLEEQGLKEALLTPDPKDDADSLKTLFNLLFDSGHDAEILSRSIYDSEAIPGRTEVLHSLLTLIGYDSVGQLQEDLEPLLALLMKLMKNVFGFDPTDENDPANQNAETGPNVSELLANSLKMMILKPLSYGKNRIDFQGDTCIIYFESFGENVKRAESFYTKLPTKADIEESTFALVWSAFDQIKKAGNIKKVVFDLSNNGGGAAAALISVLGFLSPDGEVEITYQDLVNRNYVSEYYHVDTNLDGNFDDQDGYGGQYEFYILTSGSSYSCGTALPYFAQKNKLAKIVGTRPGGGDCVVGFYVDATGRVGGISGFLKLGTMEGDTFISDEDAVEMDLPFTEEDVESVYFHPDKIASFLAERDP